MAPKLAQTSYWTHLQGRLKNPLCGAEMLDCGSEEDSPQLAAASGNPTLATDYSSKRSVRGEASAASEIAPLK